MRKSSLDQDAMVEIINNDGMEFELVDAASNSATNLKKGHSNVTHSTSNGSLD